LSGAEWRFSGQFELNIYKNEFEKSAYHKYDMPTFYMPLFDREGYRTS